MNFVSKKLNKISPSPTLAMAALASRLKKEGKKIISLSTGEPDFDTASHVKEASIKAINEGKTKYTEVDGIEELKLAIQQKFINENNISTTPSNIIVSTGAKQVIYNLFMASLNPEDEVIIPIPYWVSYPDIVNLADGVPVFIDTSHTDFKLTAQQLEQSITSKTKWVIINSPNNPTGTVYSKSDLLEIGEIIKKYDHIGIISDDIYEHLIYDTEFNTIAGLLPELKDRIVTINGVSKAYSMTGWRIGYATGPQDLIKAMVKIQSQSTSNPTSISQYAALEALLHGSDFIKNNQSIFSKRRDLMVTLLQAIPGFSAKTPNGAFYIFVNCSKILGKKSLNNKIIATSKDLSEYILEDAEVALLPGEAFGISGYLRLSYAISEDQIQEACSRIKVSLAKLI
jgi:aspartate aminotransferase